MKSKNSNTKYDDGISEIDITDEDIQISEELDFGREFSYTYIQETDPVKETDAKSQKTPSKKKNKDEQLHNGHRKRMYARYEENRFNGFQEHEVLEMLLYHGICRKDTNITAHKLIKEFGCLENVLSASYFDLIAAGLNDRAALILTQYKEVESYLRSHKSVKNIVLSDAEIAGTFCSQRFGYDPIESFHLISMNSARKVLNINLISLGTSTSTDANTAAVVKTALRNNAASVILCHNHPSGDTNPSTDDCQTTSKIIELLESVDINVADHIICYKDKYTSLFERGMI